MARYGGTKMALITILVTMNAVLATAFIAIYSQSPWRTTAVGILLMADGAYMAYMMTLQMWALLVAPVPLWLWSASTALISILLTWRIILVRMAQKDGDV
jgi:hypothetical protein